MAQFNFEEAISAVVVNYVRKSVIEFLDENPDYPLEQRKLLLRFGDFIERKNKEYNERLHG